MSSVLYIILCMLLVFAFLQDWRYRAIHWLVFPLIAIDSTLIFIQSGQHWKIIGLNLTFVSTVVLLLFVYVSLRTGKLTNIFKAHLGLGDVLFFISVIPLFGQVNYILFFGSGMILSALVHFIIQLKFKSNTIPLAGYLAGYILILGAFTGITNQDIFYNPLLP
ncbi:MAG: hypothetical protein JNJ99_06760 [Crocinitomicaceae bacterium]|nr:hypothetical protein [Crocinitomicaceae bacterium]